MHEPFGLRSNIEVVGANGLVGLGLSKHSNSHLGISLMAMMHLTDKPGLDVELDLAKLAELHQVFLNCRIRTRNDVAQMQKFRSDWKTIKPRF